MKMTLVEKIDSNEGTQIANLSELNEARYDLRVQGIQGGKFNVNQRNLGLRELENMLNYLYKIHGEFVEVYISPHPQSHQASR